MTEKFLAEELRKRYDRAKRNQTILEIDLYGIEYGTTIRQKNYSIKRIVKMSGIGESYITEVSKAIKLSEYVTIQNKEGEIEK